MRGFSLLEVLISTTLSMLVVVGGISYFKQSITTGALITLRSRDIREEALIYAHLQKCVDDYDTHRLIEGIRIHKDSVITLLDGTLLSLSTPQHARSDSDAISCLSLLSSYPLLIEKITSSGIYYTVEVCPLSPASLPGNVSIESYVAIGIEGAIELVKSGPSAKGKGRCSVHHLKKEQSLFFQEAPPAFHPRILLPIHELYTLYLSAKGELRRISHRGSHMVENQPIGMLTSSVTLSLDTTGQLPLLSWTTHPPTPYAEMHHYQLRPSLSRLPTLFYALHL